jgi:hypothetical protein
MDADEQEEFKSLASSVMASKRAAALWVAMPANSRTPTGLLALRGFNTQSVEDAAVTDLLTRMQKVDSTVDMALGGDDAIAVRMLQMKCWKHVNGTAGAGGGGIQSPMFAGTYGAAAEEAAAQTKAVKLYDRLAKTQGVEVEQREHLDYSLLNKLSSLHEKNGTINMRLGATDLKRQ